MGITTETFMTTPFKSRSMEFVRKIAIGIIKEKRQIIKTQMELILLQEKKIKELKNKRRE